MGARSGIVDVFDKLFFNFSYGGKIRPLYPSRRFFYYIPALSSRSAHFPLFPTPSGFVLWGACLVLSVSDYPINLRVLNKINRRNCVQSHFHRADGHCGKKAKCFPAAGSASKTSDKLTAKSTSMLDGVNCRMNGGVFRNCRIYSESLMFPYYFIFYIGKYEFHSEYTRVLRVVYSNDLIYDHVKVNIHFV